MIEIIRILEWMVRMLENFIAKYWILKGADSNEMREIVKSLSRNPKTDQPLLVFLSLVGNDVCNGLINKETFYLPS